MLTNTIEEVFIDKVSAQISLSAEGEDRFRVLNPFQFEDGDELVIFLKKENGRWLLSDEAHTYKHLSYDIDKKLLYKGTRLKLISKALSMFEVEYQNGELILDISHGDYGEALYDFVQAILKIIDVSYLSRERVQSTFMEDFHDLLSEKVEQARRKFGWHHERLDPYGNYTVDCRINGMPRPLFVYALSNNDKIRDATIALRCFKDWGIEYNSMGIIKDEKATNRKVLARFHDVCEVSFVDINKSRETIGQYLDEVVPADALPS